MVRGEILRRVNFIFPLKQTQVSPYRKTNMKSKTKPKTDSRVRRYCPLLIPEALHHKLKARAKDKRMRLNQYAPRLLAKALRHEDDSL
jgi:predicted HicB family RNase H-like nuclease